MRRSTAALGAVAALAIGVACSPVDRGASAETAPVVTGVGVPGDKYVWDGVQYNSLLKGHEAFYYFTFPAGTVIDQVDIDFAQQGATWGETLTAAFFATGWPKTWTDIPTNKDGISAGLSDANAGDGGHFGPPVPARAFWVCIGKNGTDQHDGCQTAVNVGHTIVSGERLWFEMDTNTTLSPEHQIVVWYH